ncbi:hypothetical protein CFP56_004977 [Quercus suber]|uniref:Uncharacterized protein n=1 Tax=Quercus suber TaxID=58331 RepID=A0AAW0L9V9_QUESU
MDAWKGKGIDYQNGRSESGSFTRFLRKPCVANVKEMAIKTTIAIPVTPSTPLKRPLYVGLVFPISEAIKAKSSGDEFIMRGKSHARWVPA